MSLEAELEALSNIGRADRAFLCKAWISKAESKLRALLCSKACCFDHACKAWPEAKWGAPPGTACSRFVTWTRDVQQLPPGRSMFNGRIMASRVEFRNEPLSLELGT